MLCEKSDDNGWSCLVLREDKWKELGKYDEVEINGKVKLPIVGGKVIFDEDSCKVKNNGNKKLVCKTRKDS